MLSTVWKGKHRCWIYYLSNKLYDTSVINTGVSSRKALCLAVQVVANKTPQMAYPNSCLVVLGALLVQVALWGTASAMLPTHHRRELQPWHRGVRQAGRRHRRATATIPKLHLILTTFRLWVGALLCKVQIAITIATRTTDWRRHCETNNGYLRITINSSYNSKDRICSNRRLALNSKNNNNRTISTDSPCKEEDPTEATSIWQRKISQHCRVLRRATARTYL